MKKKLVLVLCFGMLMGMLTACGGNSNHTTDSQDYGKQENDTTDGAESDDDTEVAMIEIPVTVSNETGVDIYSLYTTSTSLDMWSVDLLNDSVLKDGETIELTFTVGADDMEWEVLGTDSENYEVLFKGIDVSYCRTDGVRLTLETDENGYVAYAQ